MREGTKGLWSVFPLLGSLLNEMGKELGFAINLQTTSQLSSSKWGESGV